MNRFHNDFLIRYLKIAGVFSFALSLAATFFTGCYYVKQGSYALKYQCRSEPNKKLLANKKNAYRYRIIPHHIQLAFRHGMTYLFKTTPACT
jgi:hypothetical protein